MQILTPFAAVVVSALLSLEGMASAGPLFQYNREQQPVSGDCRALSAALGPEAVWYGFYSGRRYDDFTENYRPYAARGCFESEFACRVWQNQAMTYSERGPTHFTRCRRGDPS